MNRKDIFEKLKVVLKGPQFLLEDEVITMLHEETSFIYDLVFDSIQILELLVTLEEEFSIVCGPEELNVELFDKIGYLLDFIEKKVEDNQSR